METLQFKLQTQVRPVEIEDDNGNVKKYELREISAAQRDRYMNSLTKRFRLDNTGKPCGIKDFEGLHASLISLCLYNEQGTLVTPQEVNAWPAHVTQTLYKAAESLNKLDAKDEGDKEKND